MLQHVAGEELDLVLVLQPLQQGQTQLHAVTWPRLPQVFQRLVPGHKYKCNSGCALYVSFLEIVLKVLCNFVNVYIQVCVRTWEQPSSVSNYLLT